MIALANTLSESQRLSKKHEWLCWHDYFGVRFFRNWILNSRLPTILPCSSSPNPKSQLVRYPNRETVGNDHKPWCVIAFCDQWGNTLREAPTLPTILGDFTFFALSLYPSHPLPLIKKQSTGRNYDVGLSNRYFINLRAKTVLDLPTSWLITKTVN